MAAQEQDVFQLVTNAPLLVEWTAADPTNADVAPFTAGMVVLARNVHITDPFTVTFTSEPDRHGRTEDISQAIAAGEYFAFGPFTKEGWKAGSGNLNFSAPDASIEFAVIKGV